MTNVEKANPANTTAPGAKIETFQYPACAGGSPVAEWNGWVEAGDDTAAEAVHERVNDARKTPVSGEQIAEESRRSFEAGRECGLLDGRHAERESQIARAGEEEKRRKHHLAQAVARIGEERDRFLDAVEQEVVRLALAIAARILRREAQMDPLLLTGAVRVALGQMAASTEIRLLVPAAEADLWAETVASLPNLAAKPVVVAAEAMHVGECKIESKVGTVDLGVRAQLREIERGFFDRPTDPVPSKSLAAQNVPPNQEPG
jgi:flagellar assembly protein FliH